MKYCKSGDTSPHVFRLEGGVFKTYVNALFADFWNNILPSDISHRWQSCHYWSELEMVRYCYHIRTVHIYDRRLMSECFK